MSEEIMPWVMVVQAFQRLAQSPRAGKPKGVDETMLLLTSSALGWRSKGKVNAGRSRSHSEYCPLLSIHRWMGRRLASVKREKVSASEY
jgi:hypothetical protein